MGGLESAQKKVNTCRKVKKVRNGETFTKGQQAELDNFLDCIDESIDWITSKDLQFQGSQESKIQLWYLIKAMGFIVYGKDYKEKINWFYESIYNNDGRTIYEYLENNNFPGFIEEVQKVLGVTITGAMNDDTYNALSSYISENSKEKEFAEIVSNMWFISKNNDQLKYFYTLIDNKKKYKESVKYDNKLLNTIKTANSNDKFVEIINNFNLNESLEKIPLDIRIKAIKKIVTSSDILGNLNDNQQKVLLKLLKSVTKKDGDSFIKLISEFELDPKIYGNILHSIIRDLDEKYKFEAVIALRNIKLKSFGPKIAESKLKNAPIFHYPTDNIKKRSYLEDVEVLIGKGKDKISFTYWKEIYATGVKKRYSFNSMDIIGIYFPSNENPYGVKTGSTLYVPAFMIKLIYDKQFSKELGQVLAIASLISGVSGLLKGSGLITRVFAFLETLVGAVELTRDKLAQTESGRKLLKLHDTALTLISVYGAAKTTLQLENLTREMKAEIKNLRNSKSLLSVEELNALDEVFLDIPSFGSTKRKSSTKSGKGANKKGIKKTNTRKKGDKDNNQKKEKNKDSVILKKINGIRKDLWNNAREEAYKIVDRAKSKTKTAYVSVVNLTKDKDNWLNKFIKKKFNLKFNNEINPLKNKLKKKITIKPLISKFIYRAVKKSKELFNIFMKGSSVQVGWNYPDWLEQHRIGIKNIVNLNNSGRPQVLIDLYTADTRFLNFLTKHRKTRHHTYNIRYDRFGFLKFPKSMVRYEVQLHYEDWYRTRPEHLVLCTQILKDHLHKLMEKNDNQSSYNEFVLQLGLNDKQLTLIEKEKGSISGLTWHHHQESGRIQLIPTLEHQAHHYGGIDIWGKK